MTHSKINDLENVLKTRGKERPPPARLWNPPYCGEIGLRIAADGTWYYRDSAIGREALVKLFASILRREDDGRHYLVTPVEKIGIDVEDAPFLAVEMIVQGRHQNQSLTFRTNVDDMVTAGPLHPLRFKTDRKNNGLKPYLHVRGCLEALVTRAVCYDLLESASEAMIEGETRSGIWSGGRFFPLHSGAGACEAPDASS